MDDDSGRIFEMVLAFLRGGANPSDQHQVCIVPAYILFPISPPSLGCFLRSLLFFGKPSLLTQYFFIAGPSVFKEYVHNKYRDDRCS